MAPDKTRPAGHEKFHRRIIPRRCEEAKVFLGRFSRLSSAKCWVSAWLEKRIVRWCSFWDNWPMGRGLWILGMALPLILSGCGKKADSVARSTAEEAAKRTDDLPTDPEEKYKVTYIRSAQAFSRNDLENAIKFLDLAEQAKPGQANTANLRGAIYTRQRDWPKAQSAFEEALKLQPDLPMAQFNLGEVLFLNKKYAEARERFQIFVNSQPKNDLGLYKIYLCDLLGGDKAKADAFLNTLQPNPNSPLYYFAKAAEAFVKGDKTVAMEFVGSAYRIYPPDANATFADSLVEKGYLSGEQAEKIPEEDNKAKVTELKTLLPAVKKEEQKSGNLLPSAQP
ncbi:MAG: tetratricopeptide repeat protein [Verrucomicrobia bacterium]|nr:tetratricopeptide repeat protein [bacterium]NDA25701.1 tetratricopeptide repeat protein [Verrucomicrobiota bacterium]NDD56694.1 tetratricopeptide repeat protein [Verrucomicrobiota bacterium]